MPPVLRAHACWAFAVEMLEFLVALGWRSESIPGLVVTARVYVIEPLMLVLFVTL